MIKYIVGLIMTPLMAYPMTFGCLVAMDGWRGERFVLFHLRHEQRILWETFWQDYRAALPIMYLIAAMWVVSYFLLRWLWLDRLGAPTLIALGVSTGWAAAVYLTGSWTGDTHVALATSGALVGSPLALFLSRITATAGIGR